MKVFVLEIGRPIRQAVEQFFGRVDDYISIQRAITPSEIPKIAIEVYKKLMELGKDGEEVCLILSGPLALAFQIGQLLGIGKIKVIPYQFMYGRYEKIPPLTRAHLFNI